MKLHQIVTKMQLAASEHLTDQRSNADQTFIANVHQALDNGVTIAAMEEAKFDPEATANETKSSNYYGEAVPEVHFMAALKDLINAAARLDKMKKAMFYGKPYLLPREEASTVYLSCVGIPQLMFPGNETHGRDLLHSIIGQVTEAGELAELVYESVETRKPLDLVGFSEETGDMRWYQRIGLPVIGKTGVQCDMDNYAKLSAKMAAKRGTVARYGETFDANKAIHRDLSAERAGLEANFGRREAEPVFAVVNTEIPGHQHPQEYRHPSNRGFETIGQRGQTEKDDESARQHG